MAHFWSGLVSSVWTLKTFWQSELMIRYTLISLKYILCRLPNPTDGRIRSGLSYERYPLPTQNLSPKSFAWITKDDRYAVWDLSFISFVRFGGSLISFIHLFINSFHSFGLTSSSKTNLEEPILWRSPPIDSYNSNPDACSCRCIAIYNK